MTRIEGTPRTRALIGAIVRDLHAKRPATSHVNYNISIPRKGELITFEEGKDFRNVSIILLGEIRAAIGNKTGNLLLEEKSRFMTEKKALRKVVDFLETINPARRSNPKLTSTQIQFDQGKLKTAHFSSMDEEQFKIGEKTMIRTITGTNNLHYTEADETYKTL